MLELYIDNQKVPIDASTSITLEWNNMITDPKRLPGSYSYPFSLPATEAVDKLLKRPSRVGSGGIFSSPESEIRYNGVALPKGVIKIDSSSRKSHSVHILGSVYPAVTEKNLCDIEMHQYDLGAGDLKSLNWASSAAGAAYINLIQGSITKQYPQENFVAAPVMIQPPKMQGVPSGNHKNPFYGSFLNFYHNNQFRVNQLASAFHYPVYPMPYVGYLLNVLFGDFLIGNPFAEGDLARLVVPTLFHEAGRTATRGVVVDTTGNISNNYFRLNSFLPAYPARDFVANLLVTFGMGIYGNLDGYELVTYQDVVAGVGLVDWSDKLADTPIIEPVPGRQYRYGFTDQEPPDSVDYPRTVQNIAALESEVLPDDEIEEEDRQYFIPPSGQLLQIDRYDYSYSSTTVQLRRYKTIKTGLAGSGNVDNNALDMTSDIGPMPMTLAHYQGNEDFSPSAVSGIPDRERRAWYMPYCESDLSTKEYLPKIMFFRGLISRIGTNPGTYPIITAHNQDAYGNTIGNQSLHWNGASGLFENYHRGFAEWIARDKKRLSAKFNLSIQDIRTLNLKNQVYVCGERWLIETVRITLHHDNIAFADVQLISI